ncbi:MAG TPA: PspC domain-containing protein [Solirubrobacteraceae bacterium]
MATHSHEIPLSRRLRRTRQGAMVGGVCAGIARAIGADVIWVRLAFVIAVFGGGVGILAYIAGLVFMPVDESVRAPRISANLKEAAGIALLALAAMLALRALGVWLSDAVVWPVVLTTAGLAVIWRQSTVAPTPPAPVAAPAVAAAPVADAQEGVPGPRRTPLGELPRFGPRLVLGGALVVSGLITLLSSADAIGSLKDLVVAAAIITAGVTLIFGTSWLGMASALREERSARIRTEERAEMAAHLHDSVLQTLALIQREAGDDPAIAQLARRQERELRDWLAGRESPGGADAASTLAAALRAIAAEVEDAHAVEVEVVTVGDAALDDAGRALVAAAREAAVNAAKFAGTGHVDVYAEATAGRLEIFVRDRGRGFDLAAVPAERRGVRESILARMARHGGRAEVRSAPGEGTEIELVLDRRPAS